MKRSNLLLFSLMFFVSCSTPAQSPVSTGSFYAESLNRIRHYTLILPRNYSEDQRYPLLVLLHGYGGSHEDWVSRTSLEATVMDHPLIVVMPDAGNSWYVNSAASSNDRFEDFILFDLLTYMKKEYRVDTTRMAIAGLSMGGYGAVTLSLKHPRIFRFAGSLSGALSVPGDIDERERNGWGRHNVRNLREVFGPSPGPFRDRHDPLLLVRSAPPERLPFFYLVMGTEDGFTAFLPAHRRLTDSLRAVGARYEYHELPGGHSWTFWDRHIGPLIGRMMQVME